MEKKLRPLDPERWDKEFWIGLLCWIIIPIYFTYVMILGFGIATMFAMDRTRRFMERWK